MDDELGKLKQLPQLEGFSPATEKVDQWVEHLQAQGYVLFPTASDILRRYAGLEIKRVWQGRHVFDLRIDPMEAGDGEFERICPWETQAGSKLYPVGMIDGRIMVMAESGTMYAIDGSLYRLGDDIEEVISRVATRSEGCKDRPMPEKRGLPKIYEVIAVIVIMFLFLFLTLFGIGNYPRQ